MEVIVGSYRHRPFLVTTHGSFSWGWAQASVSDGGLPKGMGTMDGSQ